MQRKVTKSCHAHSDEKVPAETRAALHASLSVFGALTLTLSRMWSNGRAAQMLTPSHAPSAAEQCLSSAERPASPSGGCCSFGSTTAHRRHHPQHRNIPNPMAQYLFSFLKCSQEQCLRKLYTCCSFFLYSCSSWLRYSSTSFSASSFACFSFCCFSVRGRKAMQRIQEE